MLLSSMIPTFMLKINCKRVENLKKQIEVFITKMIEEIQNLIGGWEKQFKSVK